MRQTSRNCSSYHMFTYGQRRISTKSLQDILNISLGNYIRTRWESAYTSFVLNEMHNSNVNSLYCYKYYNGS